MHGPLEHTRYGVVAAVLVSAASLACGGGRGAAPEPRAAEVGTYTPSSVVLYLAREELTGKCGGDLAATIQFAPGQAALTPAQTVEVEKWALCLQRPELGDANVVLVPPRDADGAALFSERARHIRDALDARGVPAARVTLARPDANAAPNGRETTAEAVRIEVARPSPRPR